VQELGESIGAALLKPHRSYLSALYPLVARGAIKGMAHITGGGLVDNVPRILPEGTSARVDRSAWTVPPLFTWLQRAGNVPDQDMIRTFNMGIGMVVVCTPTLADVILDDLHARREDPVVIGEIIAGQRDVTYG
jgi:phosphoribosylformylglycinamidine cyclo-ligase